MHAFESIIEDGMEKYGLMIGAFKGGANITGVALFSTGTLTVPEHETLPARKPGLLEMVPEGYVPTPTDIIKEISATDKINVELKRLYKQNSGLCVRYRSRKAVFEVWEDHTETLEEWDSKKLKKQMEKLGSGSAVIISIIKKHKLEKFLQRDRISFAVGK